MTETFRSRNSDLHNSLALFSFLQLQANVNLIEIDKTELSETLFHCDLISLLRSRCVKCDERSRLAGSRRTRADCSHSFRNSLHCSSDNLSEAFA